MFCNYLMNISTLYQTYITGRDKLSDSFVTFKLYNKNAVYIPAYSVFNFHIFFRITIQTTDEYLHIHTAMPIDEIVYSRHFQRKDQDTDMAVRPPLQGMPT